MGYLKYISKVWKNSETVKSRLLEWRREPVIVRLEKPSRLDRARSLGYKAKQGFVVIRIRVLKGGRTRPRFKAGRKPSKMGMLKYYPKKSLRWISEEKVARKFKNMEILNSYYVGEDGVHVWHEIILVDPSHLVTKKNLGLKWIAGKSNRSRVHRGLTGAGKKSRGLTKKGPNKSRPSVASGKGRGK